MILHLFKTLDAGGAELRTLEMMQQFSESQGHFIIAVLGPRGGALEARARHLGVDVVGLPLSRGFPWAFVRLVRARRVSVLHVHSAASSGFFVALGLVAGVPIRIAHFRSDGDGRTASLRQSIRRKSLLFFVRLCATDVVAVSPSALAYAGRWTRRSRKSRVIPSGLALSPLPAEQEAVDMRARINGLSSETLVIAHVGRDLPEKNRPRAVEILAAVRSKGLDARLLFLGRSSLDERNSLEVLARKLDVLHCIVFAGQVEDVVSYLFSCNVTLVTSLREGLPGVVLESLSVGTPVVASDVPGAVWISEHLNGISILSLRESSDVWAAAISRFHERPPGELREKARDEFTNSIFSLESATQNFASLWTLEMD